MVSLQLAVVNAIKMMK